MQPVLECKQLTKRYGSLNALDAIDMVLPRGKIVGLLGPNGSGKTTFLKLAAGLLTPSSGSITISGYPIGVETKKRVSFLPERGYFNCGMKVSECLSFFEDFYPDFDRSRADEMLRKLDINPDAKLKTLSKGTQEKVQLTLVMSRRAELYLLDEPIGGVDPAAREYILNTILTNYDEGSTVVISTHLISDIEKVLDEFLFIKNGKVVRQDTVDNVRETLGMSVDELFREDFKC